MSSDKSCNLCPHYCPVDRESGQKGRCSAGQRVEISSAFLHHGEEAPISGLNPAEGGSGTIFFARCNLRCIFCQNWEISQTLPSLKSDSWEAPADELADIMLELQARGAYNINLVSPTPHVRQIEKALRIAKSRGLTVPIVYNSGGYDSLESLRIMDGLVDIYMPDAKFAPLNEEDADSPDPLASRLFGAADYVRVNRLALLEMFRQVGHLKPERTVPARRGLLVRHLVMPDDLARTSRMLPWLAENLGPELRLNLMAQYRPMFLVRKRPDEYADLPGLTRPLRIDEYQAAANQTRAVGLKRAFIRPHF